MASSRLPPTTPLNSPQRVCSRRAPGPPSPCVSRQSVVPEAQPILPETLEAFPSSSELRRESLTGFSTTHQCKCYSPPHLANAGCCQAVSNVNPGVPGPLHTQVLITDRFFIRDPAKFPRFIHTQKTDPARNVRDWNTFWSWPAQFPEALLQFLRLFSDLGTPYG